MSLSNPQKWNGSTWEATAPTVSTSQGVHNDNLLGSIDRLVKGNTYQDLSTVCVCVTRGMIAARVVQNWMALMAPMNQKFTRLFLTGMEVGKAYAQAIEIILSNPELSTWKYLLTIEEDNLPPPDGLLKLYESIQHCDVVGGLYWTKGEGGQPMIYGDPRAMPFNFIPQVPQPDSLQECNGLGQGFTLYKLAIFKDHRLPRPAFKTEQSYVPYVGAKAYTQDLYFFEQIRRLGYRVACDTRVKVGHFDQSQDIVW